MQLAVHIVLIIVGSSIDSFYLILCYLFFSAFKYVIDNANHAYYLLLSREWRLVPMVAESMLTLP